MRMAATFRTIPLRILLPIAAGVSFTAFCFAAARENHVIDISGWNHSSGNMLGWGQEPTDIGAPCDTLLLAINLPALIALLPLLPLGYWIQSEVLARTAWGLASIGQWYLIGRYFDVSRGLLAQSEWKVGLRFKKVLFSVSMTAGAITLVAGSFSIAAGHSSPWAFLWDISLAFWGIALMTLALRWRSSSAWSGDRIDSLGLR